MDLALPPSLASVDISDWDGVPPDELLRHPSRVKSHPSRLAGARALRYAHAGASTAYDEIGLRMLAASPRGPVALQTIASMQAERARQARTRAGLVFEEARSQMLKLRHRPLQPPQDGRFRYEIVDNLINMIRVPEPGGDASDATADVWTFPLSDPPQMILQLAISRDESPIVSQRYRVDLPGIFWLPFATLLRNGRFVRMQECREDLRQGTSAGCYYCFLSHRWLSPTHPDPEAAQARFAAWQIVGHLCEAIRVADQRGLHEMRKFSPMLGVVVGIAGSKLAEALLVNVLRPTLDDHSLARAIAEVASLDDSLDDYGVAAACDDSDLRRLSALLATHPTLQALLDKIYLWYDYSCLPQPPRSEADDGLFRAGLERLNAAQMVGRTAILLDDTEDYLSRAWCALEAVTADAFGSDAIDLLVGSARPTVREGTVEHYFRELLLDRPHLVWRGILDTEVFAAQTPDQCMARLGLAATEPADLPLIYQRLTRLGPPQKIHVDDSELVTGVFPLLVVQGGTNTVVMPKESGRAVARAQAPQARGTLDWIGVMRVQTRWSAADCDPRLAPFLTLASDVNDTRPPCHLAIVGSCEGEAVLFSNWVLRHRDQLERTLGMKAASLSWLATDIAPVGRFVYGALRAVPVHAPFWVVVSLGTRLRNCRVTGLLTESLAAANKGYVTVAVDEAENNVTVMSPGSGAQLPADRYDLIALGDRHPAEHVGGLFSASLLKDLL